MRILLLFLTAFQICAYDVVLPWCGRINGGDEADMFGYRMRFNGSWFQPADEISYAVPGPHSVDRLIIKVPCEPKETLFDFGGVYYERVQGTWYVRGTPEHASALRSEMPRYFSHVLSLPWAGRLAHGWREILFGRVLFFDATKSEFSTLPVERDPDRDEIVEVSEVRIRLPNGPTETECQFRGCVFSKVGNGWVFGEWAPRIAIPRDAFEVTLPWTGDIRNGSEVTAFGRSWAFTGERFIPSNDLRLVVIGTSTVSQVTFQSDAPIEGDQVDFAGQHFIKENGKWTRWTDDTKRQVDRAKKIPDGWYGVEVTLPWEGQIQEGHDVRIFGHRMMFDGTRFVAVDFPYDPPRKFHFKVYQTHAVDKLVFELPRFPDEVRVEFAGIGFERGPDGWVVGFRSSIASRADLTRWVSEASPPAIVVPADTYDANECFKVARNANTGGVRIPSPKTEVTIHPDGSWWIYTPDPDELPPIPEKPFPGLRVVVGPTTYFLEDDLKTWLRVSGYSNRIPVGHLPSKLWSILEDKEKGVFVFKSAREDGLPQADLYRPGHPYMRMATCPTYDVAVREAWRFITPPGKRAPEYNFTPVAKP